MVMTSCSAPSKVDRVGEPAFSGRVEHGVDRRHDLAHPDGQIRSVADRDGAEFPHQIVVPRCRRADDRRPPGDCELGGDHPDRAGGTEYEQGLAAGELQLLQGAHCGLCRCEQGSSIAPGDLRRFRRPRGCERIFGIPAQSGQEAGDFVTFFHPRHNEPRASTTPAASNPSTASGGLAKNRTSPLRIFRSVGLTPADLTRMRTWPAPGSGIVTSLQAKTSGGPYSVRTMALGIEDPPETGAGLPYPIMKPAADSAIPEIHSSGRDSR